MIHHVQARNLNAPLSGTMTVEVGHINFDVQGRLKLGSTNNPSGRALSCEGWIQGRAACWVKSSKAQNGCINIKMPNLRPHPSIDCTRVGVMRKKSGLRVGDGLE
jgi:hypothetical protein